MRIFFISFIFLSFLILQGCSSRSSLNEFQVVDKKTIGLLPTEVESSLIPIMEFKGVQVSGVSVSPDGRLFACFPRLRENVPFSVVEIMPDGTHKPFPNENWNTWNGSEAEGRFTSAQALLIHEDSLFILDSSNPELKGVVGKAKLYEFDLRKNQLKRVWEFDEQVAPERSNLNDFELDSKDQKVYVTDSGLGGIVMLDLKTSESKRLLDKHPSTKAENVTLTVDHKLFLLPNGKRPKIHSDGIAISPIDNKLYYHALTGYHLYRVPTAALSSTTKDETQLVKKIEKLGVTPAPAGMIFDKKGNLYMADLERNAISYRTPSGEIKILIQDERIKWPDSFTIDNANNLIFSDSLRQEAVVGADVDDLVFRIYSVPLPK